MMHHLTLNTFAIYSFLRERINLALTLLHLRVRQLQSIVYFPYYYSPTAMIYSDLELEQTLEARCKQLN